MFQVDTIIIEVNLPLSGQPIDVAKSRWHRPFLDSLLEHQLTLTSWILLKEYHNQHFDYLIIFPNFEKGRSEDGGHMGARPPPPP